MGWLKTTEIYSLRDLEARTLKSRCPQDHDISKECLGKDPSFPLPSFWWFPTILSFPWLQAVSLRLLSLSQGIPPSLCLYLCPNFSLHIRAPVIESGPTLIQYDFILNCLHLQIHYFQIRSYSHVPGGHDFWENVFNPVHFPYQFWEGNFVLHNFSTVHLQGVGSNH